VTVDTVDTLARDRAIRYQRLTRAFEWPMAILALAVIPALLLDNGAATPRTHAIASAANWIIWLAFCAEFGARFALAPDRQRFVRRSWSDLLIIVVSPPFGVPESSRPPSPVCS
jgi:voltage-gated potassium channel